MRAIREFAVRKLKDQLNPDTPESTHQVASSFRLHHALRGAAAPLHVDGYLEVLRKAQQELLSEKLLGVNGYGWAARPQEEATLNPTYHALGALGFQKYDGMIAGNHLARANALSHDARKFIVELGAIGKSDGVSEMCWTQGEGESVAATSLAVMSLFEGEDRDARRAAALGAQWLKRELGERLSSTKVRHWEVIRDTIHTGAYPVTAMGALAYVSAVEKLTEPPAFLIEAVVALDGMWNQRICGWDADNEGCSYVGTSRTIVELEKALRARGLSWQAVMASSRKKRRGPRRPAVEVLPVESQQVAEFGSRGLFCTMPDGRSHHVPLTPGERALVRVLIEAPGPLTRSAVAQRLVEEGHHAPGRPLHAVADESVSKIITRLQSKIFGVEGLRQLVQSKGYPVTESRSLGNRGEPMVVASWVIRPGLPDGA